MSGLHPLLDYLFDGGCPPGPLVTHMLSCVSRAFRGAIMEHYGLTLGQFCFSHSPERGLTVTVHNDPLRWGPVELSSEPPPVGWWKPCDSVELRSDRGGPLRALGGLARLIVGEWPEAPITRLSFDCRDDGGGGGRRAREGIIRSLLSAVSPTIERLRVDSPDGEVFEAPAPRLRSLHVSDCTGGELRALGRWLVSSPLRELKCSRAWDVDAEALMELTAMNQHHRSLQRLVLDASSIGANCVQRVQAPDTLLELRLTGCSGVDSLDVSSFSNLRILQLNRTAIALEHVSGLSACAELVTLNLSGCEIVRDASILCSLPHIRELTLSNTAITNGGIRGLSECVTLEQLDLGECEQLSDVNVLCSLPHLRELTLSNTAITDSGIKALSRCVAPERLDLSLCYRLSDVNVLGYLPRLRELFLSDVAITNSRIRDLSQCVTLERLDLHGCKRLSKVNVLCFLPCLRELTLYNTAITDDGIRGLSQCVTLERLDLHGCKQLSDVNVLGCLPRFHALRFNSNE